MHASMVMGACRNAQVMLMSTTFCSSHLPGEVEDIGLALFLSNYSFYNFVILIFLYLENLSV